MNELQAKSNEFYGKLAIERGDKTTVTGRYAFDAGKEVYIWEDIVRKLGVTPDTTFFDIGCGCGLLAELCIDYMAKNNIASSMIDIKEVIEAAQKSILKDVKFEHIRLYSGVFPDELPRDFFLTQRFDRILMYSVIQCSGEPLRLVEAAVELLRPGGKLLIGDLSNVNKKGRFLASTNGRRFEAQYRGITIDDVPQYKNHHDFVSKTARGHTATINDSLIVTILSRYRYLGYDVYVLPQHEELPFCFTREDLLICKHD